MTTSTLSFKSLPRLALSEGASTPNPGIAGVWIWSTTLSKPLYWNGSTWQSPLTLSTTGTVSGLTAGTVTTNANLTGPITSVGNTTSVGSQTGTGSVFVMQASPTLTTPNLGTPSAVVLTNATGTASSLTSGITLALKSSTTTVDVAAATAPTTGQVLTATSSTTATWQTASSSASRLAYAAF